MKVALLLLALAAAVSGNVYDLFFPAYLPGCPKGCLNWFAKKKKKKRKKKEKSEKSENAWPCQ